MTFTHCRTCDNLTLVADETCSRCGHELDHVGVRKDLPKIDPNQTHEGAQSIANVEPFTGAGSVLGPAIGFFCTNIWFITKLVFVLFAPLEIIRFYKFGGEPTGWQQSLGISAMTMICSLIIAPSLTYGLFKTLKDGKNPSLHECYRWGISRLPHYLVCSIVVVILTVIGFVCLVIPGLILLVAFLPVTPLATLEKRSMSDTLQRSLYLTKGFRVSIFLAAAGMMLLANLVKVPFGFLTEISGLALWPLQILIALVTDILDQSTTVLALVVYASIMQTPRGLYDLP